MGVAGRLKNFKTISRFTDWWYYKVPALLCFAYLFISINSISFGQSWTSLGLFLIWTTATASIGYIINEIADIRCDQMAGKANRMVSIPRARRHLLLLTLLLISFIPWVFLPLTGVILALLIFELFLFIIYSLPPFRLKESVFGAVTADALYGHAVITLIAALMFSSMGSRGKAGIGFFISLFFWQCVKGLRNILLHQIDDRKNDRKSHIDTFVLKYGPLTSVNLINRFILPLELLLFGLILAFISGHLRLFYLWFAAFLGFTFLKFSLWKVFSISLRHFKKKFLYFMNDFYEEWMPVAALIYGLSLSPLFWILLAVHLALFYRLLDKGRRDILTIGKNLGEAVRRRISGEEAESSEG